MIASTPRVSWFRWRIDVWKVARDEIVLAIRHGCHRRSALILRWRAVHVEINWYIEWFPPDHDRACPFHFDHAALEEWLDIERLRMSK